MVRFIIILFIRHKVIETIDLEVEKMKLIEASRVSKEELEQFLQNNNQIDINTLLKSGYVVKCEGKIIGCFELKLVDDGAFWLKQLYIIRNEAVKLPVLLEFILVFAKQKRAKVVFAHSEQPVTDLLLESLSFSLHEDENFELQKNKNRKGHWWAYEVS